jgi:histidinol-phosphate aminotransferase
MSPTPDMTDLAFINAPIRAMPVFAGVPGPDDCDAVYLHLNESPWPPAPAIIAAIVAAAARVNRYAEPRPVGLGRAIAARHGVAPDTVVIGNGSDEILQMIATMTAAPGTDAVMPTPSFPRYRIGTRIMGGEPRLVRVLPDGRNDVEGLLAAVTPATRVVYACTPNNPSGATLPPDEIAHLARCVPEHVLLVVDEAYADFAMAEGENDALPALAERRGPWISTRTLSKAQALAGLRLGYALCSSRALADSLVKVKLNFNVSGLAVAAAEAALADPGFTRDSVLRIISARGDLADGLAALGYATLPSRTNFVAFDSGEDAVALVARMGARGVHIREWRDPGFETFARITVGTPQENVAALKALADCRTCLAAGAAAPVGSAARG